MRLLLMIALAVPCGGTAYEGATGPTTPEIAVVPAPSDPPPTERMRTLERQCRETIPGTTFQEAARALSQVRASIGRYCSVALVGETPLEWRVSCGADALFESGRYALSGDTEGSTPVVTCDGGRNAFACLGRGLRSMLPHVARVDVAVVGHVDQQLPAQARLDCPELKEGWEAVPWSRATNTREAANERLAWCRAARASRALAEGLGSSVHTAAIGNGSRWLDARLDRQGAVDHARALERLRPGDEPPADPPAAANCPNPGSASDEPAAGKCQSARRVDVLVRLEARPSRADTECSRDGATPEDVLFCLEECAARPEQSQSALANPHAFFGSGSTETRVGERFVTRTSGAGAVDVARIDERLGLAAPR
ncbi:MAG: hypothetical protein H6721_23505 [Sandaracinus sp.]|nr:hypothetical protein [Myxococcales bacterium]MCB9621566.1 hypothetical protein [Sandaracinus sp.]MCB9635104.1 hypothetical protein [Sandaracinus sp.]